MKKKQQAGVADTSDRVPMTRHSMFIADPEWAAVQQGRAKTVLESEAAFVRACIRLGAAAVVKKYSRK